MHGRSGFRAPPRDGAQSIARAIFVLRILASARGAGLGLSEVARQAGLTPPTARRILSVLVREEIVEQRSQTRRYRIGQQISLLALARPATTPLIAAALPVLGEVVEDLGDTGFLTLRTGLDTVCLGRRLGAYPIQVLSIDVGDRRPLGVSSAGIAALAGLPAVEARRILQQNTARLASYDVSLREAQAAVAAARGRGFALRERGLVPGTRAVSVAFAVPSGEEQVLAALTIAAVARRLSRDRIGEVVARLRRAADAIAVPLAGKPAPAARPARHRRLPAQ
ncbi:MAG: IclR family transcriptional regulator [Hyphomicrobiaceae bacterium]|nr:IclR family transcriptional regulator [Hyphomicrobiaceae bacterium]